MHQQQSEIHIEGLGQPVLIRSNRRARRFTLRINQSSQQAILTLPPRAKLDDAKSFVTSNISWLRQQLEKIPPQIPFQDGNIIPLRGIEHRLIIQNAGRGQRIVSVGESGDSPAIFIKGHTDHAPRRLQDWLKKEAKKDLENRVNWHAKNLSLRPKRISVRDQRSRWGSCSSTGALSFSWRLILAPENVLDYVAAHEVAHLKEMNHGPNFWALVRKTMPHMDQAQDWLKSNGPSLHRYGATDA